MSFRNSLIPLAAATVFAIACSAPAHAAEASQASLLKQAKVTKEAATKTALAKVPGGTIKDSELENENGALVWSFDITLPKDRNIHEVQVNALTGMIASSVIETPKDQAKELVQDRKEAKKARKESKEEANEEAMEAKKTK
ncbi:PepSY domain-containing protein [Thermomonas sp.]|uniref:PepSY domain-containing protein n=1 Tax=Thermomonas sp. TaxID=1971895 RepID=UPI002487C2F8|nr:PepSY domain-containing protein [Thermomonas sp.]MDI1251761.1 PepSY domain-containing protein [Thermomonas sp.]